MIINFNHKKKEKLTRVLETLEIFKNLDTSVITIKKKKRPFNQILDGQNFKPCELFVRRKRKKR